MNTTEPVHSYTFEIWPDPMPAATYPMLVPDRLTVTSEHTAGAARCLADARVPAGQALGYVYHNRTRCVPPHPGRD